MQQCRALKVLTTKGIRMGKAEPLGIVIIGAGGHASVAAEIITARSTLENRYELLGFLDDDPKMIGTQVHGKPVLGSTKDLDQIPHGGIFIAIGDNQARRRVFQECILNGENVISLIHPESITASDVIMGSGVMIAPGVVVNPGSTIGTNVIINTSASVDHHNAIADHVHIAPGVHLGGDVSIGEGTLVGIGAVVVPQCTIGAWSIIGAGAVVREPINDHILAAGVPAKAIKSLEIGDVS